MTPQHDEARADNTTAIIEGAYLSLLRLPHGDSRGRLQRVLATLRDEVAYINGSFPSDIQDEFEARARSTPVPTGWQTIDSAPKCVASSHTDNGKRPVLVTRWPITGTYPPVAIARLTRDGWISGEKGKRLYFEPTHWAPLYENVPPFPLVPGDKMNHPQEGETNG